MDMNIMMNCQMNQGTICLTYAFQVQMVEFFFVLLIYIRMLCFVHLSFQNPSPLAPFVSISVVFADFYQFLNNKL